jgi:hypothetical protein
MTSMILTGCLGRDPELLERGLGSQDAGLPGRLRASEVLGVDLQQELSARHRLAFVHSKIGDAPHRVGADVHRAFRFDLAGCRDDRLEIAARDGFDVDDEGFGTAPPVDAVARRAGDKKDQTSDQDFLASAHEPPNAPIIAATPVAMRA